MNTSGSLFHQAGHITSETWKDSTSDQALKNLAIAAITAGTIQGISMGLDAMNSANAANAANGANSATTLQLPSGTTNTALTFNTPASSIATPSTTFASNVNSLTLTDRVINAIQGSMIQTVASSAAQSAVNGDSFADAIKNSTKNLLINAVGQVAANEIGNLAHGNVDAEGYVLENGTNSRLTYFGEEIKQINTARQLILHAALGCAMATAGGNNCAAGAAAGSLAEAIGSQLYNNGNGLNKQNTIAVGQLTGAISAAAISGPDDGGSVFAGSNIGYNAVANNTLYVAKSNNRIVASDGQNNHLVVLVDGNEEKNLLELQLKQKLPLQTDKLSGRIILQALVYEDSVLSSLGSKIANIAPSNLIGVSVANVAGLLTNLSPSNAIGTFAGLTESVALVSPSYQLQTKGIFYDLTNKNDFTNLALMTGNTGISYSENILDTIFNNYSDQNMQTNIFFQNGMLNNTASAREIGTMLEKATGREVGLIINSTGGVDDVTEFLPNRLYLKDALNGEVYQQIANNGNARNLIIMHSAGNEDAKKTAAVLALNKVNLGNNIEFMSVGSPSSLKALQSQLAPVGGNVIGQYNSLLDPVTQSKAWTVGTSALFVGGIAVGVKYGMALGASGDIASASTGLEAFFAKGIAATKVFAGGAAGGAAGFGTGYYLLDNNHPFVTYFNKDFKGVQTDIKNWSVQNPAR